MNPPKEARGVNSWVPAAILNTVPRFDAPPNCVVPKRLPLPSITRPATGLAPLAPSKETRSVGVRMAGVTRSSSHSTLRRVVRRGRAPKRGWCRRVPMKLVFRLLSQLVKENDIVDLQSKGSEDQFLSSPPNNLFCSNGWRY